MTNHRWVLEVAVSNPLARCFDQSGTLRVRFGAMSPTLPLSSPSFLPCFSCAARHDPSGATPLTNRKATASTSLPSVVHTHAYGDNRITKSLLSSARPLSMPQVQLAVRALLRHVKSTASASELIEDENGTSTLLCGRDRAPPTPHGATLKATCTCWSEINFWQNLCQLVLFRSSALSYAAAEACTAASAFQVRLYWL